MSITAKSEDQSLMQRLIPSLSAYISKMQSREKLLAAVAIIAVLFITISELTSFITEKTTAQEASLKQALNDVDSVTAALFRYNTLKNRLKLIEDAYKEVQFEVTESYFERLLKQKAGLSKDFVIRSKPTKEFGGNYQQTSFMIRFTIVDPNRLIDFLKELHQGSKPVLISKIDIKARNSKDALDVELEVASIRKIK